MPDEAWLVAIGAGREQMAVIQRAKARNLPVLALDGNAAAPGLALADERLVVDIADTDAVLAALQGRRLGGVLPAPIGRHLRTVGAVNDRFGLRGITEQAATRCTDKALFHQTMLAHGLTRPMQRAVQGLDELRMAVADIGLPCVIKPRFGSGSRGVLLLDDEAALAGAFAEFAGWVGEAEPAVVEGVLQGAEYGVDGVVIEGRFQLLLLRAKTMTALPYRQEVAYLSPAPVAAQHRQGIIDAVDAAVSALGLDQCALNADVMLDESGRPSIIEIAGRPPGQLIADMILPRALDMDFYDNLIDFVLSGCFALPGVEERAVAFGFLPLRSGKVLGTPTDRGGVICRLPEVGTVLQPLRSGADALARGWTMSVADTASQAKAELQACIDLLTQEILINDN